MPLPPPALQEEYDALDRRMMRAEEVRRAKEELLQEAQVELYLERSRVIEQGIMLKELQARAKHARERPHTPTPTPQHPSARHHAQPPSLRPPWCVPMCESIRQRSTTHPHSALLFSARQERSAATELELQSQLQFCRQALARALQAQRQSSGEALPDEWGEPLPPPTTAEQLGGGSGLGGGGSGGSVAGGLDLGLGGGGLGLGSGGAPRHATPQQVELAMVWAEELMGEVRPKHLADGGNDVSGGGGGAAEAGRSDLEARLARRVEAAAIASSPAAGSS